MLYPFKVPSFYSQAQPECFGAVPTVSDLKALRKQAFGMMRTQFLFYVGLLNSNGHWCLALN